MILPGVMEWWKADPLLFFSRSSICLYLSAIYIIKSLVPLFEKGDFASRAQNVAASYYNFGERHCLFSCKERTQAGSWILQYYVQLKLPLYYVNHLWHLLKGKRIRSNSDFALDHFERRLHHILAQE